MPVLGEQTCFFFKQGGLWEDSVVLQVNTEEKEVSRAGLGPWPRGVGHRRSPEQMRADMHVGTWHVAPAGRALGEQDGGRVGLLPGEAPPRVPSRALVCPPGFQILPSGPQRSQPG